MNNDMNSKCSFPTWFDGRRYLDYLSDVVSTLDGVEDSSNDYADIFRELRAAVSDSSLPSDVREDFARICEDAANQMILVHNATNAASRAAETVADALRGMPAKAPHSTIDAGDDDRGLIDATSVRELDTHDLATVGYDEADQALDMLEFVMCALAAMESTYSDEVVNGCVQTIESAVVTLREYIGDTREALLMAADGRAKQRKYQQIF